MRFLDSGSPLRCGRNDEFSYRANKQLSDQSDLKLSWPMHALKRCGLNVGAIAWPGNKREMTECGFPFTV